MAKRGDLARENVKDTIVQAFQSTGNFVAIQDKKIYVTAKDGDNGETIQFAITMTMPKTPITNAAGAFDTVEDNSPSTELTDQDKVAVNRLMKQLGIA